MRREEAVNLKIWNLPERSGLDLSRLEASFTIIGKGRKKRLIYLATRSLLEIYDYIMTERLANFMQALVKEQGIASRIPVPYGQLTVAHGHPPPMKLIGWYAITSPP